MAAAVSEYHEQSVAGNGNCAAATVSGVSVGEL